MHPPAHSPPTPAFTSSLAMASSCTGCAGLDDEGEPHGPRLMDCRQTVRSLKSARPNSACHAANPRRFVHRTREDLPAHSPRSSAAMPSLPGSGLPKHPLKARYQPSAAARGWRALAQAPAASRHHPTLAAHYPACLKAHETRRQAGSCRSRRPSWRTEVRKKCPSRDKSCQKGSPRLPSSLPSPVG